MKTCVQLFLGTLPLSSLSGAGLFIYEPTPYLSEEDSPFIQGIRAGTIYLEDFEDQALNTPFVTAPDNLGYFGQTMRGISPNRLPGEVARLLPRLRQLRDHGACRSAPWRWSETGATTHSSLDA